MDISSFEAQAEQYTDQLFHSECSQEYSFLEHQASIYAKRKECMDYEFDQYLFELEEKYAE